MLKQRVLTAIVLLAILLPALFYNSPAPFCVLALLMIAAGAWAQAPAAIINRASTQKGAGEL